MHQFWPVETPCEEEAFWQPEQPAVLSSLHFTQKTGISLQVINKNVTEVTLSSIINETVKSLKSLPILTQ